MLAGCVWMLMDAGWMRMDADGCWHCLRMDADGCWLDADCWRMEWMPDAS
jgi:hypothetical protein